MLGKSRDSSHVHEEVVTEVIDEGVNLVLLLDMESKRGNILRVEPSKSLRTTRQEMLGKADDIGRNRTKWSASKRL